MVIASLLPFLNREEMEVLSMSQYSSKVFSRQYDRSQSISVVTSQSRVLCLTDQYRLM
jgi:hypothetical protein